MAEISAMLANLEIKEPSQNHAPQPVAHATSDRGSASIYRFAIRPGSVVFRYDVDITQTYNNVTKALTRASDDGQRFLNRRICDSLIRVVQSRFNFREAGRQNEPLVMYVYDGRKNLFLQRETDFTEHTFKVNANEISPDLRAYLSAEQIDVKIQKSASFMLRLDDYDSSMLKNMHDQADHSLRTFLELLTSQSFFNNCQYDVIGPGKIYESRDVEDVSYACVTKQGFQKGVRLIENKASITPALVMDVQTSVFYKPMDMCEVLRKAKTLGPDIGAVLNSMSSFFKGIRGYLTHNPRRTVIFEGFGQAMNSMTLKLKTGEEISFANFYDKKGVKIDVLQMPSIKVESSGTPLYFPPQLFKILPYQRVPIQKMNRAISETLLKANSTKPFIRFRSIQEKVRLIDDQFLFAFGVKLDKQKPIDISLGRRPLPVYVMREGDKACNVNPDNSGNYKMERGVKFYSPAVINRWVFLCKPNMGNNYTGDWNKITKEGGFVGMRIDKPEIKMLKANIPVEAQLAALFEEFARNKVSFVVLYDNKSDNSHEELKRCEIRYRVLTQHLTYEILHEARSATMKNILLKMNMKNRGFNYLPLYTGLSESACGRLNLANNNILIFAYDVSHPAPASSIQKGKLYAMNMKEFKSLEPSVVGFSANTAAEAANFVGDYFYQPSKKESVNPENLAATFQYCINKAKANRKGFDPKVIFVLRDGVSEGQYQMAVRDELSALRKVAPKCSFLFAVVSKRHGKRFFAGDDRGVNNPTKCSVIDEVAVRPDIHEFYMMSHRPIQGTAKIPQYAILANDTRIPADVVQQFMNCMCHTHQISLGGTSLPAPIFLAHELAKRGRNNYLAESKLDSRKRTQQYVNLADKDPKFNELNELLSYKNAGMLSNTRFTA